MYTPLLSVLSLGFAGRLRHTGSRTARTPWRGSPILSADTGTLCPLLVSFSVGCLRCISVPVVADFLPMPFRHLLRRETKCLQCSGGNRSAHRGTISAICRKFAAPHFFVIRRRVNFENVSETHVRLHSKLHILLAKRRKCMYSRSCV